VDDTADDTAAICMEGQVTLELLRDYNITVSIRNPTVPGQPFYQDLVSIFQALQVRHARAGHRCVRSRP
jgi:hypothetical protein